MIALYTNNANKKEEYLGRKITNNAEQFVYMNTEFFGHPVEDYELSMQQDNVT